MLGTVRLLSDIEHSIRSHLTGCQVLFVAESG